LDECARIMVGQARAYEPATLEQVVFGVFGDEARSAFEAALG
jgi:O-acetyl-ADP-ribose deacetylase (regulator of RNase III)